MTSPTRVPAFAAVVAACAVVSGAPAAAQTPPADAVVVIDGLMWAAASNGEDVPWTPASEYCETLDAAGHDDWRLPTLAELEGLHDPGNAGNGFIVSPIELAGCCLWSSTSLDELGPEEGGARGGQRDDPSNYYWGFLYADGIRYYSVNFFPDGQALCVRDID